MTNDLTQLARYIRTWEWKVTEQVVAKAKTEPLKVIFDVNPTHNTRQLARFRLINPDNPQLANTYHRKQK